MLFDSFLKDLLDLRTRVRLEADALPSHARRHLASQCFRKIKSVGDGNDDKLALLLLRPLEDAVEDLEVPSLEKVYLVDDQHPNSSKWYLHWLSNSLNPSNFLFFSK